MCNDVPIHGAQIRVGADREILDNIGQPVEANLASDDERTEGHHGSRADEADLHGTATAADPADGLTQQGKRQHGAGCGPMEQDMAADGGEFEEQDRRERETR